MVGPNPQDGTISNYQMSLQLFSQLACNVANQGGV